MSAPNGGWTFETLRRYLETHDRVIADRLDEQDKRIAATLTQVDRRYEQMIADRDTAVNVAIAELSRRLEGMNEFRASLEDQSRRSMPRNEAEILINGLKAEIEKTRVAMETRVNETRIALEGRTDAASLSMKEDLGVLRDQQNQSKGQVAGFAAIVGVFVVLGVLVAFAAAVL